MARFQLIVGIPISLLFIGTISYLRSFLQIKSQNEQQISIDTFSGVENILSSMNASVDPCENFYDYACQGWNTKNPMPDYMPLWSEFPKLGKEVTNAVIETLEKPVSTQDFPSLLQAKQHYRKCTQVNEDDTDLQAMLDVLDKYGGWPILHDDGNWNGSRFHWIKSTTGLKRRFSETVILNAMSYQYPYWRNETNTIVITPPTKSSGDFYGNVDESSDLNLPTRLKYLIVNISKTFLEFQGKTNINETYLEEKAMEIIKVSAELSYVNKNEDAILPTLIKCLGLLQQGNCGRYDLDFIQSHLHNSTFPKTNKLNIRAFLQALYKTKHIYHFNQPIIIDPEYLFKLGKYLSLVKTDEELANFLHFRMILKMIPLMGHKYLNTLVSDFGGSFSGVTAKPDRSIICAIDTQQKFFLAVGQAYVNTRGSTNIEFEMIRSMFRNLQESTEHLIENTKEPYLDKSLLKLENNVTRLCLGYPSWMKANNVSKMQSEYNGLALNESSTFLENSMAFNSWKLDKSLKSIEKMLQEPSGENDCEWTNFLGNVGAYNLFTHYLVYLPLGIIQPPFISLNLPMAINYGKLGSILGHEIVHSLVVPELVELKNGSLTPFAQCLVDQYDEFRTTEIEGNVSLSGTRTLMENIPDNLGLLASYKAFKKVILVQESDKKPKGLEGYTDEQLFFLGFAQNWCGTSTQNMLRNSMQSDNHPPGIYRALGTLQNSKEFSQAWKCPEGSVMNPDPEVKEKCSLT